VHLEWHQLRLDRSHPLYFAKAKPIVLREVVQVPAFAKSGLFKCRMTYAAEVESLEFGRYQRRRIRSLRLVDAGEVSYAHKWLDRSAIKRLLAQRADADDILMVGSDGCITDSSIANIAVYDGECWLTPARPLLAGTCRARLLRLGKLQEAELHPEDLRKFQKIRLFNAMTGWSAAWEISIAHIF
jgi:4-amino-4-deoxychorismate lyase